MDNFDNNEFNLPNVDNESPENTGPVSQPSSMPTWFKAMLAGALLLLIIAVAILVYFIGGSQPENANERAFSKPPVLSQPITLDPAVMVNPINDSPSPVLAAPILRTDVQNNTVPVVSEAPSDFIELPSVSQSIENIQNTIAEMGDVLSEMKEELVSLKDNDRDQRSDMRQLKDRFLDFKEEQRAARPLKSPTLPFNVTSIKQLGTIIHVSVSDDVETLDLGINQQWKGWRLSGVDLSGRRVQFMFKDQITRITVSI